MNRDELNINDWVMIKDYPMKPEPKKFTEKYCLRSLCEFSPIPITERILKANGFEKYNGTTEFEEQEYCWTINGTFITIYFRDNKIYKCVFGQEFLYFVHHQIQYVHELQHALRLCGCDERANNFVIE